MFQHLLFGLGTRDLQDKRLLILVPARDLNRVPLEQHYIKPLGKLGIEPNKILAVSLDMGPKHKPNSGIAKNNLSEIEAVAKHIGITHVLVADGTHFKTLTGMTKSEPHYGYLINSKWTGIKATPIHSYRQLYLNNRLGSMITLSLEAVSRDMQNQKGVFQEKILRNVQYPSRPQDIKEALDLLGQCARLTCDIETHGLKLDQAGILTIAFGINEHDGVAFFVGSSQPVREMLKDFFINYRGTLIFHNCTFDTKVLIWELFMKGPLDTEGMLEGLDVMHRDLEDTRIIAYLAINNTYMNNLGLKELAFEYTGNYALDDITNVSNIPAADLLIYCITDAVATWYVYKKFRTQVLAEQEDVYQKVFRPALKVLTQTELVGMPMNLGEVLNTEHQLDDIRIINKNFLNNHPIILEFSQALREEAASKATAKLKKKVKTAEDFLLMTFNHGSPVQLRKLFYEYLALPCFGTTDTELPSTDASALEKLSKHLMEKYNINEQEIHAILPIVGGT